jgi:hypothetical protein
MGMKTKKIWLTSILAAYVLLAETTYVIFSDLHKFNVFAAGEEETLGTSLNAVDVYVLRCTDTSVPTRAWAFVLEMGVDSGYRFEGQPPDGTRIYLQLLSPLTGVTQKTTAVDGGWYNGDVGRSSSILTADGSTFLLQVGKDRTTATPVYYGLVANCAGSSGASRPHTLTMVQDQ